MKEKNSKQVLLTSNINLSDIDGKSLRLLGIAEVFEKAGFKVSLLVRSCNSQSCKKYSVLTTSVPLKDTLTYSLSKKALHYFRQSIHLFSFYIKFFISRPKYDIIVSSLAGIELDSMLACILSKFNRVPFVYDYDDPSPELRMTFFRVSANDPRVKLSRLTRNILIKNSSMVLAASNSLKAQIMSDLNNTPNVHVWYNLPKFDFDCTNKNKEILRKKLGLATESFIISYIGRMASWGIEPMANVLKSFGKDFDCKENVFFIIIGGGGSWEQYYRKLAVDMERSDRIIVTGMLPRQDALEYFMASDVSCVPFAHSIASKLIVPTKLFESMALGIPVLCAKTDNYLSILGDDGIFFSGDPNEISEKVRWCMLNRDRIREISSNLKVKFNDEYSWEKRALILQKEINLLLKS